ncbi:unnamed protein product, partial [Nesidiocoris tenuis]
MINRIRRIWNVESIFVAAGLQPFSPSSPPWYRAAVQAGTVVTPSPPEATSTSSSEARPVLRFNDLRRPSIGGP